MNKRRFSVPSTSALVAFESAARHGNFSRAAQELNTSQSAVSRHIADLEGRLGARLFDRHKKGVILNAQGSYFQQAVISGLDRIQAAAAVISNWTEGDEITIACTHEISHLFLMPRYEALEAALGREVQIRIMTHEYDTLGLHLESRIDVTFAYEFLDKAPSDYVQVFQEAVQPVCAPTFAKEHHAVLCQPVSSWSGLPFLQLTKRNQGWATWEDWLASTDTAGLAPEFIRFDNYVYLLEAAASGRGLALGWRGLIERHLSSGTLVPVSDCYVSFDRALYAVLTPRGRNRRAAIACLDFLAKA
ncbi:LysR family transcriptional regulator [Pelagibius sp. Alg239-R121]|uniref:LysR family transcriptional regulator n=1 Tax=Pelagibius sp. Alg239-R121 TaxID=2993448 RepID=UPI0024A63895|nr:LysR family transcriptional regulator [Pelagibius sp. Alg239-R121]